MFKKIFVLILLLTMVIGCTPDETADPAELPPAESTSDEAVNPVEEPVEEPDVTIVAPADSVDLGELTPEAGTDEDGEVIVQPEPGMPDPEVQQLVEIASQHLADRLGIDISEVTLVETVAQDWPDSGLGCPSPDELYAAVVTPGYEITLEADGESYTYHTDSSEHVVLCVDGSPAADL